MSLSPVLSLCAGTVLPVGLAGTVDVAAAAGYRWVGLRPDPAIDGRELAAVQARLASTGVQVFDIEVVRLGVTPAADAERFVELAAAFDARWLLVTSHLSDPAETTRQLAALVSRCERFGGELRPAFEFMAFTEVRTIHDALPIVRDTGAGLIVDALHVYRNGHDPAVVRAALADNPPPVYLQLCDSDGAPRAGDELIEEARHGRLIPGTGVLPIADFVAAVPPGTAVAAEVQSDALLASIGPLELARRCMVAVESAMASAGEVRA